MLKEKAKEELISYGEKNFGKGIFDEVRPGVWYAQGIGHSNATVIEGETSVILVDTLDTVERAEVLKKEIQKHIQKPVKTILFTHSHPDHRMGAGAFKDTVEEVIAMRPKQGPPQGMGKLGAVLNKRGLYQFGFPLSDEEAIHQGLGPRQGAVYGQREETLAATTLYEEGEVIHREIDGVELRLISAAGETPDTMMVEIPSHKILCCGDNYYGTWPNLYALRGTPYREVAKWIEALDTILALDLDVLLPGHTKAIEGKAKIQEIVGSYREAIAHVYEKTLEALAEDASLDEAVARAALPEHLRDLPHLQEHYGTVAWSAKSIYTGHVGWFDGRASMLNPLSEEGWKEGLASLLGGSEGLYKAAEEAFEKENYAFSLALIEPLQRTEQEEKYDALYVKVLHALAERETSANGRHYYLCLAYEVEQKEKLLPWLSGKENLFETKN